MSYGFALLCPRGIGRPGAYSVRVFRTCVLAYVRMSEDQVRSFGKSRISRPRDISLGDQQEYARDITS